MMVRESPPIFAIAFSIRFSRQSPWAPARGGSRYRAASGAAAVRRHGLTETMSAYLIEQLAQIPNIRIRQRMEIDRVEGDGRLERVWLKSLDSERPITEETDALFVFIGTRPHSDWLPPAVLRNEK